MTAVQMPKIKFPLLLSKIANAAYFVLDIRLLVALLLVSLLTISWLATAIGIMHLGQIGDDSSSFGEYSLVLFGSAILTILMWLMLERARLPGSILIRSACAVFYVFLLAWAVGFGYGFWWTTIAAKDRSATQIISGLTSLREQSITISTSLGTLDTSLSELSRISREMVNSEDSTGGSCGKYSGRTQGNLWSIRNGLDKTINAKIEQIVGKKGWKNKVTSEASKVNKLLNRSKTNNATTSQARNTEFSNIYNETQQIVAKINAVSGVANQTALDFDNLAAPLEIKPGKPGFICCDNGLATLLRSAAGTIRAKPIHVTMSSWRPMEGNQSTEVALLKLWGTFGGFFGSGITSERMIETDWVALLAAIAVDIGILIVTLIRPRAGGQTFMGEDDLDETAVRQIDRDLRRHREAALVVFFDMHFSMGRKQYVAIPGGDWKGPAGITARELHTVVGALAPRLAAMRETNPSSTLVRAAKVRLERLGWTAPGNPADDNSLTSFKLWILNRWHGSVLPIHPIIYNIGQEDRNLAMRLLDEAQQHERRLSRGAWDMGASDQEAQLSPLTEQAAPSVASIALMDSLFLATKNHQENGQIEDANDALQRLRDEIARQSDSFDVIGLDGVIGKPFSPSEPFLAMRAAASDFPVNTIASVERLAVVKLTDGVTDVLRIGRVTLSAGQAAL